MGDCKNALVETNGDIEAAIEILRKKGIAKAAKRAGITEDADAPVKSDRNDRENLIAELRAQHAVLTGTRLRDELIRRHGFPCGVSRIYRLLHQTTQPQPASPVTVPPGTGDIATAVRKVVIKVKI